ncbi:hypothetical protein [Sphingobacterium psychroaquaticum]|uniref:Uncharacterized protein n=1 Tax=Sphingobacterium psychroaquaticum TaxID=561061 RepID=A0A1X7ILZ3_9SPHI|nr:hypothetical protein [Sphingobacterium psychroaquaticum]SMG15588.1 hypothetical protein SAMN05660862_0973 [Sphingobacterium psychroaquaticum]
MITGIPNANEYKQIAMECLIQAYNSIVSVDNALTNSTPREKIWEYNQIVLRSGLVLIHQGIEGLLKSEICKTSPLLLIEKKRGDWKTLPESADENFSELYTIGGEDLLRTYYACIGAKKVHEKFLQLYEEIRVRRNKIVHGIGNEKLTPEYILTLILDTFTYLLGKDSFWEAASSKFYQHPGFQYEDEDVEWEDMIHYNKMEHLSFFLGKKTLKKHFSVDITARPYLCPHCTEKSEIATKKGAKRADSKWAFLHPNDPLGTNLSCIVCQSDFGVLREDCGKDGCKGNVKYLIEDDDDSETYICLTCWHDETREAS